ncbi:hypothetical protein LJK88_33620 [Paenibacillus sp. P26]|nr:hypothetical protein LJK88_33620 [Paenibacillus sp. P26]
MMMLMMIAAGCKDKPAASNDIHTSPEVQPVVTAVPASQEKPKDTVTDPAVPSPAAPPAAESDKVAKTSSDQDAGANPDGGSAAKDGAKSPAGKPKIQIDSPFTEAKPTLLGLSLKTGADEIKQRFGKPKEEFSMENDADPITVYDYGYFMVGFNGKNELQFIDVRSPEIDPGLNGLKLGDPAGEVTKALGKPDSNTSVVMTYKAKGAILKLDIDPKTQKVNSIKLFGA